MDVMDKRYSSSVNKRKIIIGTELDSFVRKILTKLKGLNMDSSERTNI